MQAHSDCIAQPLYIIAVLYADVVIETPFYNHISYRMPFMQVHAFIEKRVHNNGPCRCVIPKHSALLETTRACVYSISRWSGCVGPPLADGRLYTDTGTGAEHISMPATNKLQTLCPLHSDCPCGLQFESESNPGSAACDCV